MSYLVIPVYSFECEAGPCNATYDTTPWRESDTQPLLRAAHRELRHAGWQVRRREPGDPPSPHGQVTWTHWCPRHKRRPRWKPSGTMSPGQSATTRGT